MAYRVAKILGRGFTALARASDTVGSPVLLDEVGMLDRDVRMVLLAATSEFGWFTARPELAPETRHLNPAEAF